MQNVIVDTPLCFDFPEPFIDICCFLFCCPDDTYLFKVNSENIRKICEICSPITRKTPKRLPWLPHYDVFVVDFEQISHIQLVFPLMTLKR